MAKVYLQKDQRSGSTYAYRVEQYRDPKPEECARDASTWAG